MTIKKKIGVAILFVSLVLPIYSQQLDEAGLELIDQSSVEDGVEYQVRTPGGISAVIRIPDGSPVLDMDKILQTVELIDGMELMQAASVRIVQRDASFEIVVVPDAFQFQGVQLMAYLPAGIQFFVADEIEYDFRMVVEEYFLRIDGRWFSEQQFAETLLRAVRNPRAFLRSRDPEVVAQRLREAERRLDELQFQASREEDRVTRLEQDNSELQRISKSDGQMLRYLQETVYIENTRGFFGGLNLPEPNLFSRAQSIKENEPEIGLEGLRERLQADGFSVSARDVALILSIYYNEHAR